MKSFKYFEIRELKKQFPDARYYIIIGKRSCGKTYSVVQDSIDDAIDGKGMFAYVRRLQDSIKSTHIQDLLNPHNEHVYKKTNGEYNKITFYRGRWYLDLWDYDKNIRIARKPEPIGAAMSLSTWEKTKGQDIGLVKNIIFDEFLSAGGLYLEDEFTKFQQVISSLVRDRTEADTKIYLLGNPVSRHGGPYWEAMDIKQSMLEKSGTTLIKYNGENDDSMTAVLWFRMEDDEVRQEQDAVYKTYFAFPNSKLKSKSITSGTWELSDSPMLEKGQYKCSTNVRTIYIIYDEAVYAAEILRHDKSGLYYVFYRPASKVKECEYYMVNKPVFDKYALVINRTKKPKNPIFDVLFAVASSGQVYYSSNEVADAIRAFYNSTA